MTQDKQQEVEITPALRAQVKHFYEHLARLNSSHNLVPLFAVMNVMLSPYAPAGQNFFRQSYLAWDAKTPEVQESFAKAIARYVGKKEVPAEQLLELFLQDVKVGYENSHIRRDLPYLLAGYTPRVLPTRAPSPGVPENLPAPASAPAPNVNTVSQDGVGVPSQEVSGPARAA